jgi:RNA polymerase sigma factor (sigma-70 family)
MKGWVYPMPEEVVDWIDIAARMLEADPDAIGQFTLFFSERLRRVYLARHVPAAAAEDIAVDCIHKLARRIHQFDSSRGTLEEWVHSSGLNSLRDWIRQDRLVAKVPYVDNIPHRPLYGGSHPDQTMQLVVQQAVLHLSATDQKIIEMKFCEDRNHRQIGEALGLSHESVRKHYERALSRLRTLLKQDLRVQARILGTRRTATYT